MIRHIFLLVLMPCAVLAQQAAEAPHDTTRTGQAVRAGTLTNLPIAVPDVFSLTEDETLEVTDPAFGLLSNDYDPDGQTVTLASITPIDIAGALSVSTDGTFTFTPDEFFTGTTSFTYRILDTDSNQSADATVTLDVQPDGNRLATGYPDFYRAFEDSVLTVVPEAGLLSNDLDLDGDPVFIAEFGDSDLDGAISLLTDGSFVFTPTPGFTGTTSFNYKLQLTVTRKSDPIPVTIEVLPDPNRPPIAFQDYYGTPVNTPISVPAGRGLTSNDLDPDGDSISVTSTDASGTDGTVTSSADGSFTFDPDNGFEGITSFTYTIEDDASNSVGPNTVVVYVGVATSDLSATLNLFLSGPYSTSTELMETTLRDNQLLPLSQPYASAPWDYAGMESVRSMPAGVVDWVLVQLRQDTAELPVMATRAALLKEDGTIVDTDGTSPVVFAGVTPGSYYVGVEHRNHIGVISSVPVPFAPAAGFDFGRGNQALGTNTQVNLVRGQFGLWPGDADANGSADAQDALIYARESSTRPTPGYHATDFDLNGIIATPDAVVQWIAANGR